MAAIADDKVPAEVHEPRVAVHDAAFEQVVVNEQRARAAGQGTLQGLRAEVGELLDLGEDKLPELPVVHFDGSVFEHPSVLEPDRGLGGAQAGLHVDGVLFVEVRKVEDVEVVVHLLQGVGPRISAHRQRRGRLGLG